MSSPSLSPPPSDADDRSGEDTTGGAAAQPPIMRVRLEGVHGADVLRWLIACQECSRGSGVTLVNFDGDAADFAVSRNSLVLFAEVVAGVASAPSSDNALEGQVSDQSKSATTSMCPAPLYQPDRLDRNPLTLLLRLPPWSRRLLLLVLFACGLAVLAGAIPVLITHDSRRTERPRGDVTADQDRANAGTAAPQNSGRTQTSGGTTQLLGRDLSGGCIPEPGTAACSPLRLALWSGDSNAWAAWSAARGEGAQAAGALAAAVEMRLAAGDPAARIRLAWANNEPLPLIASVTIEGGESRSRLVGAEIANLGATSADLSGAEVAGLGGLASGFVLPSGGRCALGAAAGPACPTVQPSARPTALPQDSNVMLRAVDGRVLDSFRVRSGR